MIETLVMPLPSGVTQAIIDIAVVLGQLVFFLMITIIIVVGGLLYPFAFSLTIPVSLSSLPLYCVFCHVIITLVLCILLCHHYHVVYYTLVCYHYPVTVFCIVLSLPHYYVLYCVIITLLLCSVLYHHYTLLLCTTLCYHYLVTVYYVVLSLPCYCVLCCVIITPIIVLFIGQIFVANLVKDKHERHVIMMEQCGGCDHIDHMTSHDL